MRFLHAAAVLSVLCAFAGMAATTTTKSTAAKKVNSTTTKKAVSSSAKKGTGSVKTASPAAKTVAAKTAAKGKKAPVVASWRTHQQNPTPDRYREIQQALVDKGYLKSEPTGVWDSQSVDALQRFQADQKMTATGKINAPSLIGLGLGAKSAGAPEAPPLGSVPGAANSVAGPPPADPVTPSVPAPATQ